MPDNRRLKLLRFAPELLMNMVRRGARFEVIRDDLPTDATYAGADWDPIARCFLIRVRSAEYPPVPEGEPIPDHGPPMIRNLLN